MKLEMSQGLRYSSMNDRHEKKQSLRPGDCLGLQPLVKGRSAASEATKTTALPSTVGQGGFVMDSQGIDMDGTKWHSDVSNFTVVLTGPPKLTAKAERKKRLTRPRSAWPHEDLGTSCQ